MSDLQDRPADSATPLDPAGAPMSPEGDPIDPFVFSLPSQASNLREHALWAAVLVLLTLVTYWPATSGQFIWDDARHVTDNKLLTDAAGLKTIWLGRWTDTAHYPLPQYYPLTHTSYWIEYHLFGVDSTTGAIDPFPFHVTNIALHAISAILLWLILVRLGVPGAWVAAAVFALHPLDVESVAWISERKNVLAGVMFFGSILLYLAADSESEKGRSPEKQWGLYAAALVVFTLAMFSKTTACAMPAVMVLVLWWKHRLSPKQWGLLAPFFVIGLALGLATAAFERSSVGAVGDEWAFSGGDRLIIAGRAIWFYVGKLLLPTRLIFSYPKWTIDASNVLQYLPGAAVVAVLGLLLALQRKIGRAPFVAGAAFIVCLFPALGFFNLYPMRWTFVADHYAYLATAVFATAVVGGIGLLFKGSTQDPSKVALPTVLAIGVMIACGSVAWSRTHVLVSSLSLWRDTVAKNPNSWLAHDNLGVALNRQAVLDRGDGDIKISDTELADAVVNEHEALRLHPGDANAELTLALALGGQGKLVESLPHYQRAISLDSRQTEAMKDEARALIHLRRFDEAIVLLDRALETAPHSSVTHQYLGDAYLNKGNDERAIAEYDLAIQIKPDNYASHVALGELLAKHHDYHDAAISLYPVVKADPSRSDVWNMLGRIEAEQGRLDVATKFFQTALTGDPTNAEYQANLDKTAAVMKEGPATHAASTRATRRPATKP